MWGEEGNCPGAIGDLGTITALPHATGRVGNVTNFIFKITKMMPTGAVVFIVVGILGTSTRTDGAREFLNSKAAVNGAKQSVARYRSASDATFTPVNIVTDESGSSWCALMHEAAPAPILTPPHASAPCAHHATGTRAACAHAPSCAHALPTPPQLRSLQTTTRSRQRTSPSRASAALPVAAALSTALRSARRAFSVLLP